MVLGTACSRLRELLAQLRSPVNLGYEFLICRSNMFSQRHKGLRLNMFRDILTLSKADGLGTACSSVLQTACCSTDACMRRGDGYTRPAFSGRRGSHIRMERTMGPKTCPWVLQNILFLIVGAIFLRSATSDIFLENVLLNRLLRTCFTRELWTLPRAALRAVSAAP